MIADTPATDDLDIAALAPRVRVGDRRALARAITLIESRRADHQARADALLGDLLGDSGRALRLAITGAPGVGKSTFIEALGLHLVAAGHRPAVLAIDPSSARSGGSLLGDKTRMEELSRHDRAFIRPSPSSGTLGGVARRTREAILLCEAAGFDPVIVETVGVGQSETTAASLTDMFVLLLAPGGGDELQGLKRGIVELADLVLINKADGALVASARALAADYRSALDILRPRRDNWRPEVQLCSALERCGIAEAWAVAQRYRAELGSSGEIERGRAEQAREWLWREVREQLIADLADDPGFARAIAALEADVVVGRILPTVAARRLLDQYRARRRAG